MVIHTSVNERRYMENQDNRVLNRQGARILTEKEVKVVSGAITTTTKCSILPGGKVDGDPHEC